MAVTYNIISLFVCFFLNKIERNKRKRKKNLFSKSIIFNSDIKFVYTFTIIILVAITKNFNERSTGKKRFTAITYRIEQC